MPSKLCSSLKSNHKFVVKFLVLLSALNIICAINNDNWKMVSAGYGHTLALAEDGRLLAWGDNADGQLGIQVNFWSYTPTSTNYPVRVMPEEQFKFIFAGYDNSFAITTDGRLYAWGYNRRGNLGIGFNWFSYSERWPVRVGSDSDWKSIAASRTHTIGLKMDGSLYVWGDSADGVLGLGIDCSDTASPTRLEIGEKVSSISVTDSRSFAITTKGALYAWGDNYCGQLGDNTTTRRYRPVRVYDDLNTTWKAVAALTTGTFAISSNGTLYGWGGDSFNGFFQLGLAPIKISNRTYWKSITSNRYHAFATTFNGSVFVAGKNWYGQLGIGNFTTLFENFTTSLNDTWLQVSAGGDHSVGILTNRSIRTWGGNFYGQLGDHFNYQGKSITPGPISAYYGTGSRNSLGYISRFKLVLILSLVGMFLICCLGCCCYRCYRRKKLEKQAQAEDNFVSIEAVPQNTPLFILYQNNPRA